MKIEIWSDYACPFCYIGKRNLELAIKEIPDSGSIEVLMKSFELDVTASAQVTSATPERISRKYGYNSQQAMQMIENVNEAAKNVGLAFHYETTRYTNMLDAHRLTKYAEGRGKGHEITEKLFHAYFNENKELSDPQVLIGIGSEIGISEFEVRRVIKSDLYASEVRQDEQEAAALGIRSVPYFLINRKYVISGAQPAVFIKETLLNILDEEKKQLELLNDGIACGIDGCSI